MPENLTAASNGPPQISPSDFAALKSELIFAIVAKDSAVAKVRSVRKRMESAGCDMKALDLHLKLAKLDTEVAELYLRNTARMNAWAGIPIGGQATLFGSDDAGAPSDKAKDELAGAAAFEAGYRAAQGGQKHDDNPYDPGTDWNQRWAQGWHAGAKVIEEVLAGQPPKVAGARRPGRRSARQAAAA